MIYATEAGHDDAAGSISGFHFASLFTFTCTKDAFNQTLDDIHPIWAMYKKKYQWNLLLSCVESCLSQ